MRVLSRPRLGLVLAAVLLRLAALPDIALAQAKDSRANKPVRGDLRVWERGLLASDAEVRSSSAVSLLDSSHPEAHRILAAALAADKSVVTRVSVLKAAAFRRDERFVDAAGRCLAAEETALVQAGAGYLGAIATWEAFRTLREFLRSPGVAVPRKVTAIAALQGYSSKVVVEVLIGQLDSPSEDVRKAAASVLGRIAGQGFGDDKAAWLKWWEANRGLTRERWLEGVVDILHKDVQELQAENAKLEQEIAESHQRLFAALQGEQRAAELSSSLSSRHAAVRAAAAIAAGRSGLKSAAPGLRKCLKDPSPQVRAAAVRALGTLAEEGPVGELTALLQDEAAEVRAAAAKALGKRKSTEAVAELCRLARSEDEALAEASIDALGQIGDPQANVPLLAALKNPSAKVREAAARALGATSPKAAGDTRPDPGVVQGLAAALADENERVRWYAVQSLGQMSARGAEGALIGKLSDASPRVREAAASTLGSIGSLKARDALVALLPDADERVAHQAAEALMSLAQKHADQTAALAQVFFDRRDFSRAATLWQARLASEKNLAQARALRQKLARAHAELRDWPQVVMHLTEAAKLPNGNPSLLAELAHAHLELKAFTQAAQACAQFMSAAPQRGPEHWQMALCIAQGLVEQKEAQKALTFIAALRAADPELGGGATKAQLQAIETNLKSTLQDAEKPKGQVGPLKQGAPQDKAGKGP